MKAKTLKFKTHLVGPILDRTKRITWRVFDDKQLSVGDQLSLVNSDTGAEFGEAVVELDTLSTLGRMYLEDSDAHEAYESESQMIALFKGYYGDSVNAATEVKVIEFRLH
jgi:hypothetical protein